MATYTSNYGWTKPSGSDNVDISVLNNNLDDQDSTIHDAFLNMAPPFSESSTYAVDDIVLYTTGLYKCHTAVVTPGSWTGSTNWQVYKLSEGGGGGTSNYNDLTNKPSINGVTLSGNKTTSDLGITASGVGAIPSTDKGANGGVAELDSNGRVPSSQLPSYVDDVLSYSSQSAFPATGETGKIYIAEDTNKTYRWSGSAYAEISASLALGETSSTAYRGDRGKTAYDHSQTTGNPHGTTASDVGLGNVPNVTTNDQTPTFTEASTRNNIASGEKLSVILGKIAKFFNDLKTVAFSGSFSDLSNKPSINSVELSGNKTTGDLGINADNVMMSDGVTSVEDAVDGQAFTYTADGVKTYSQCLNALFGLCQNAIDITKWQDIKLYQKVLSSSIMTTFVCNAYSSSQIKLQRTNSDNNNFSIATIILTANSSEYLQYSNSGGSVYTDQIPENGMKFCLIVK